VEGEEDEKIEEKQNNKKENRKDEKKRKTEREERLVKDYYIPDNQQCTILLGLLPLCAAIIEHLQPIF